MAGTPESKVKQQVTNILKRYNIWYFMPVSRGMSCHGVTDYICCIKGRFMGVECKGTDEGKPTALQAMQISRIRESGGLVFLVTPSTLGEFENHVIKLSGE